MQWSILAKTCVEELIEKIDVERTSLKDFVEKKCGEEIRSRFIIMQWIVLYWKAHGIFHLSAV